MFWRRRHSVPALRAAPAAPLALHGAPPPPVHHAWQAAWPPSPPGADPYRDPVLRSLPHSRFGGLWTDLANALERAEGRRALGSISADEHALLVHWIEKGYVILPGAVPSAWIEALEADLEQVWRVGHPNAWISAIENGRGVVRPLAPADADSVDSLVKLVDAYEYLETARRIAFAPAIQRFLELVFERPPMAHQSLSFYRGSKQPMHQDTAFVRVSSPLELAASWVALEDVVPGCGELAYYEGSHRFPEFLFGGQWKWVYPGNPQLPEYYEHLARCAGERGLEPKCFLPRRGDVLIWSADLAHGGSAYQDATRTRRSLVTHYCPVDCHPMYFHYGEHTGRIRCGERSWYCAMRKVPWVSGGGEE